MPYCRTSRKRLQRLRDSGEISLESFSGVGYIGFRYTAPAGASGYRTYCIDNVVAGQDGQGGETLYDPDEPGHLWAGGPVLRSRPILPADVVALNNPADRIRLHGLKVTL